MDSHALAVDLTIACSRFARSAARRADAGVSSVAWRVSASLERWGPLRLSEIAAQEQVTRPTASVVVRRLEEQGLVRRRTDTADSRSQLIELTDAGRDGLRVWRVGLGEALADDVEALTPAERRTLSQAVEILTALTDAGQPEGLRRP